jgi:hypothetical protein
MPNAINSYRSEGDNECSEVVLNVEPLHDTPVDLFNGTGAAGDEHSAIVL